MCVVCACGRVPVRVRVQVNYLVQQGVVVALCQQLESTDSTVSRAAVQLGPSPSPRSPADDPGPTGGAGGASAEGWEHCGGDHANRGGSRSGEDCTTTAPQRSRHL